MESIHAHEVIKLILTQQEPCTEARLQEIVEATFGPDPVFHSCSKSNMSFADLIEFLLRRGKAVSVDGSLGIIRDQVCREL